MPQPRWDDHASRPRYRDVPEYYPGEGGGPRRRSPSERRAPRAGEPREGQRRDAAPSRWGRLPGRLGVVLVAGGALAGLLISLLAGTGPGAVLGGFVLAATAAAVFAVEPGAVYLIIPAPALAYAAAALATGLLLDRASGTSATALAISVAQWSASGFLAMTAATVLAAAVTIARRPRRRASGPGGPAGRGASGPAGRGPGGRAGRGAGGGRARQVARE